MNAVRLLRYERGLSLADAAAQSGVGRNTLSRIENDHTRAISGEVAGKLAAFYEVPVERILGIGSGRQAA